MGGLRQQAGDAGNGLMGTGHAGFAEQDDIPFVDLSVKSGAFVDMALSG